MMWFTQFKEKGLIIVYIVFVFYYFCVPCGKFELPYLGKVQQLQEQHYPFLPVCVIFSCVQTMVWLPVFGILNVCTDADACDCAQGLYGHCRRVWTRWEVDSGRKFPCHTGDSNTQLLNRALDRLSYPRPQTPLFYQNNNIGGTLSNLLN